MPKQAIIAQTGNYFPNGKFVPKGAIKHVLDQVSLMKMIEGIFANPAIISMMEFTFLHRLTAFI